MSLFKKKEAASEAACCCGKNCMPEDIEKAESARGDGARIKILGSGCAKCQALESATKDALTEMEKDVSIAHVTDFAQIAAYGVMTTPAVGVDENVVSYGKALKKDEVKSILGKVL